MLKLVLDMMKNVKLIAMSPGGSKLAYLDGD